MVRCLQQSEHDRESNFKEAQLEFAFNAVVACAVMLVAQFGPMEAFRWRAEFGWFFIFQKAPTWAPSEMYVDPAPSAWAPRPFAFPQLAENRHLDSDRRLSVKGARKSRRGLKRANKRPLTCPPGEAGRVWKVSNRGHSALANHRSFVPGSEIGAGCSKGASRLQTPRWTTDGQCTDE